MRIAPITLKSDIVLGSDLQLSEPLLPANLAVANGWKLNVLSASLNTLPRLLNHRLPLFHFMNPSITMGLLPDKNFTLP